MTNTPCYFKCESFAACAQFFNEETFDQAASHQIHRKLGLALIESLLCTSLSKQKAELLFPTMKKHEYFHVSGKFHILFHSFAFPKASHFPGGAALGPSLSVLTWRQGAPSQEELCWQRRVSLLLVPSYFCWPCGGRGKSVMPEPKAELCSSLVFNGITSQSKTHPFNRGTNVLPGFC